MKKVKFSLNILISIFLVAVIAIFEINNWPVGGSLAGVLLGLVLPHLQELCQDLSDVTDWMTTQRSLMRGRMIKDDTIIRISFAYLYRIKIDNKYSEFCMVLKYKRINCFPSFM